MTFTPGTGGSGTLSGTLTASPNLTYIVEIFSNSSAAVAGLEQGKTYCRPTEPPPEPLPYCTRSLGVADCWRDPASLPGRPPDLGDIPHPLTPEQEANRTRRWPPL